MDQKVGRMEAGVSEDLRIQTRPGDSPSQASPSQSFRFFHPLGNNDIHLCRVLCGIPVGNCGHYVLSRTILISQIGIGT